jgi:hypothetical protein
MYWSPDASFWLHVTLTDFPVVKTEIFGDQEVGNMP